jgi:hypothetical protein
MKYQIISPKTIKKLYHITSRQLLAATAQLGAVRVAEIERCKIAVRFADCQNHSVSPVRTYRPDLG